MGISDIKIPTKIIVGLLTVSVVAGASMVYGAMVTHRVSDRAQALIQGEEAAAIWLSRASQRVYRSGDIAYRGLSRSNPVEIRELYGRFDGCLAEFLERMEKAKAALPSRAAQIDRWMAEYKVIVAAGRKAGEAAATGRQDVALKQLEENFDKPLDQMKAELTKAVAEYADQGKAAADAAAADADQAIFAQALTVGSAILAVLAAMIWLALAGISRPLGRLATRMETLAAGALDEPIEGVERGDEVGVMSRAVGVFRTNAIEMRRLEADQANAAARTEAEKKKAMRDLADRFEQAVGSVVSMVSSAATELQATASTLTSSAEETSSQSIAVSSASEEASTNVQTVSAAADQLAASVQEISHQVEQSSRVTAQAVDEAERTSAEVSGLAGAVEKIGSIVGLINDIAAQTNLLALNATIEAARAGESGRGFAVVAAEVKGLAGQTAKATAEIGLQISEVQGSTHKATDRIREIANTIKQMSEISTIIAGSVTEQSAATREIARNVQQAALGTHEVTQNISGVTRAAEESSAAASQVLSSAGDLSRQSELLRREVSTFLASVRAA